MVHEWPMIELKSCSRMRCRRELEGVLHKVIVGATQA